VRLVFAVVLVHQGQPQIGHVRPHALVVAAHHAVEIDGRWGADEGGDGPHLRQLAGEVTDFPGLRRRCFQAAVLGHVDHHLDLVLVVVGQQFQRHQAEQRQAGGEDEQQQHSPQHEVGAATRLQERH
jgi:hypothetical protein